MSKIAEGLTEALAVAKGDEPAARLYVNGHYYVPEDQWKPIETAPKYPLRDGGPNDFAGIGCSSPIILLIPFSEPTVTVGWWDSTKVSRTHANGCWRHLDEDGPFDIQPTHWRPLPLPPST